MGDTGLEITTAGRKRDELMLLEDRAEVARMLHQGITSTRDIQARINSRRTDRSLHVSVNTIRADIHWLREQWKNAAIIDYGAYANQVFDELQNLKSVCWEEFVSSKSIKVTRTEEASTSDDEIIDTLEGKETSAKVKRIIVKEERREGNVAYLQMIDKIIDRQIKLRGLDSVTKIALTNAKGEDLDSAKQDVLLTLAAMNKSSKQANSDTESEESEESE